ncbi:MAG: hypothetical protein DRN15_03520 [Thermoprotei archaeon]|nr:MAG: hypothetical protein DRN15_03520 [Thermoprotei archaeon]
MRWMREISKRLKRTKEALVATTYIIGIAMSDGFRDEYRFRVRLAKRNRRGEDQWPVIESVATALRKMGLQPKIRIWDKWYEVEAYSKQLSELVRLVKTSKESVKRLIRGYGRHFLKGYYEGDGCLYKQSECDWDIVFKSKKWSNLVVIAWALKRLGIGYKGIYRTVTKEGVDYILKITEQSEVEKFLKIVCPSVKNPISPQRPPQALLSYCILSGW